MWPFGLVSPEVYSGAAAGRSTFDDVKWLRPFVGPKGNVCGFCARKLRQGRVPIGDSPVSYAMRWCESCKTGWTPADTGTDYRMYKKDGAWHARPR